MKLKLYMRPVFTFWKNWGVRVEDSEIRASLYELGGEITGDRVKIPAPIMEKVLTGVTREIEFVGRNGKQVHLKPGNTVTHATGGIPGIIDRRTGQKRNALLTDFINALRLMDHLDQLDMPCALFYPDDVPGQISQIRQFEHMLKYTRKPIYGPGVSSPQEAKYIAELFQLFSDQQNIKKEQYIGLLGISPESPLYFPQEITDTMKIIIKAGIPVVALSAPVVGISGPMTIAGSIGQMNAEILAFAVIAHTINPQTPVIYGSRQNYPNMKNGSSIWGLPEVGIGNVVASQLARRLGFLIDVYGLSCTSCTFDNQNGYEKAINGLLPVMGGANLISGFGSMANLMVASLEQLVIDNELFAMLRKAKKGVQVNRDTLALDIITNVIQEGGTFLEQEHTVRYLRQGEVFIPKLGFDHSYSEWEATGRKDIRMRAGEVVDNILSQDSVTDLPEEMEREIDLIIDKAYQELVLGK
ncbi:MAG: trimethylamine methyltransferase family protein [Dehalobacterium sp.]